MTTVGQMYEQWEQEEKAKRVVLPPLEDVLLEIVSVSVKETKAEDGKRFVPRFRVVEGEYVGCMFYADSWATSPAAMPFTAETLRALGLTVEELRAAETHDEIASKLEGRRFRCSL